MEEMPERLKRDTTVVSEIVIFRAAVKENALKRAGLAEGEFNPLAVEACEPANMLWEIRNTIQ